MPGFAGGAPFSLSVPKESWKEEKRQPTEHEGRTSIVIHIIILLEQLALVGEGPGFAVLFLKLVSPVTS